MVKTAFLILGLIVAAVLFAFFVLLRILKKLRPTPAPPFIGRILTSRLRRALQSPEKVVQRGKIREGMCVLEVGCGSGAITTALSRAVSEGGEVWAIDVQEAMLRQLRQRLQRPEFHDVRNVRIRRDDACRMQFDDASFDAVVMCNVLPEIPDQEGALAEAKRVLRPGGLLSVSELLIDPDYCLRSTTIERVTRAGYHLDEAFGSIWEYTVTFRKPCD